MSVGQTEYITYTFPKRAKQEEKIAFVFENRSESKRNIISKKIKASIFRFFFSLSSINIIFQNVYMEIYNL